MTKSKITAILGTAIAFSPAIALAQGGNLLGLLTLVEQIVSRLIPVLVALALIYFIVGLIRFVIAADAEKREDGKKMMLWGIISLFVIVSIWGIITYIAGILNIGQQTTIPIPKVQ
ncbi:MAG TPA: hypothetical protein VJK09_01880 [Candidatus Paceibacterota bacterium]